MVAETSRPCGGLLGAKVPEPFEDGWRLFYTQQHGDNIKFEGNGNGKDKNKNKDQITVRASTLAENRASPRFSAVFLSFTYNTGIVTIYLRHPP